MTLLLRSFLFHLCLVATTTLAASNLPLHDAARSGDKIKVETLLAQGADVNAKNSTGWTSLQYAAARGHKDVVELLIAKGADVNAKNSTGWSSLHNAAAWGHKDVVELLIVKGADVNAKTNNGVTPLGYAAMAGKRDVAELLVAKGADVNTKNATTPLHAAAVKIEKDTQQATAEQERKEARRRERREAWAILKPDVDESANRNPNKARRLATAEALVAKPTDGDNRVSKALNLYAENLERRYPNTAGSSPSGSGTGTGVSPARQMESTGGPSAVNRTGGYTSPGNMPSREIAACDSDIKSKQLESQNWGGDANDRANRLGRYQKQLFEGRCAGHPQARAYIAGADRMLGYRRDDSTSASTSSGQSTSGGSSSSSTNSEVRDFPAPDRNSCLRVVENTRGGHCNSRSSALVRVKNVCPEKIKMQLCVWDTRNNRNRWNCGASTGRAGEKYLDSVLNYVCESDGRYFYAGCSEQATKGRFRNGNCGGDPNTDKHSLIPN